MIEWDSQNVVSETMPGYLVSSSPLKQTCCHLLSGEPDYFGRNEISSGGDLSHYSSASLY